MAEKIQIWKPDTCDCVIVMQFDNDIGFDDPKATAVESYTNPRGEVHRTIICKDHDGKKIDNIFQSAKEHNTRKNDAIREAIKSIPALQGLKGDEPVFEWSFEGVADDRVLSLSFAGVAVTAEEKDAFQAALEKSIGTDKAVVE